MLNDPAQTGSGIGSSIGKLLDISAFRASLDAWALIPTAFSEAVSIAVPLVELATAGVWFTRLTRGLAIAACAGLIGIFTLVYGAHRMFAMAPNCNCLAELERHLRLHALTGSLLVRDGALLTILAVGSFLRRGQDATPAFTRHSATPSVKGARAAEAFTIVEMLVAVVVIAALCALLVPALSSARQGGRRAVSASNLRSHTQIFAIYESDYRGFFPYYTRPTLADSEIEIPGTGGASYSVRYFWGTAMWNYVLADQYYDGQPYHDSFYPPGYPDGHGAPALRTGPTPYNINCTFLADPAYWDPRRRIGPAQWRAVRADETQLPSQKILLLNLFTPEVLTTNAPPARLELGFVDGASSMLAAGRIRNGYPAGDGPEMAPVHQNDGPPGQHTLNGVLGRDID